MAELQCRSEGGKHYIDGLMVPWNEEATIAGRAEVFEPGGLVLPDGFDVIPFRYGHPLQGPSHSEAIPIGVLSRAIDTDMGLWTEWQLFDSPGGQNAWHAAYGGAVDGLSPEFVRATAAPAGPRRDVGQGRITAKEPARMVAGSLTEHPAYAGAKVVNVRAVDLRRRTPAADELSAYLDAMKRGSRR